MHIIDIIAKKRDGMALSKEEIDFLIHSYTQGHIPDYQMSAFLMATYFQKMNDEEATYLALAMRDSGDSIDLSSIPGIKVDKHSTGGVGDKVTLILGPLLASLGVKFAKMSGRGLGHTGGTLDKLESIPGMEIVLTDDQFVRQVNRIGLAIMGQSKNLVPADKLMYALRDVTGTVDSIPLIASSIMSKKIATGADAILLDVKYGSGAFFKTPEDSRKLAETMIAIGKNLGRDTRALLTNMNQPLGLAIGNILEVKEAIATLRGHGPQDLVELCVEAGSEMLLQAGVATTKKAARQQLLQVIADGSAFEKLVLMVESQGGNGEFIRNPDLFPVAAYHHQIRAQASGYIHDINALAIGEGAMLLGAGRAKKDDIIDYTAGILIHKKIGDAVEKGEVLFDVYTHREDIDEILVDLLNAMEIGTRKVTVPPVIHSVVK
jgi:pyrimidine-nucleoside phosphorylase